MMPAAGHVLPAVILLVEDDPGDQELTRRAIEACRLRNELRIVRDGEEALEYLLRTGRYEDATTAPRPDLVLLDLNLPRVNGREVLRRMRDDPYLRRIPVVVLTTSHEEEDVIKSYELGSNSYITKPLDIHQFVRVVQQLERYWFQIVVLPPNEE
ncbi:MAG: response regulator [Candidatus Hydrogenedentes bacterium]|nr:response regulator [Candidatus Hydrogenedentota bacterium]